jgi:hypothetical protein
MKIENVQDGFATLLLRIDGYGSPLALGHLQSQNINGTIDWKEYTLRLSYPEGAEDIYVAGILVGKGKAWFDDFVLTIDNESIQTLKESEKPVFKASLDTAYDSGSGIVFPQVTDELITNLELLGRIWGFLKYHHPEVGKGNYNWDFELFRMLPEFLEAEDFSARDRVLLSWIAKYGEIAECNQCKETAPDAFLKPDLSWIDNSDMDPELMEKLEYIYKNRHQGSQYYIRMISNVRNPRFRNENPYNWMKYPDEGFRLLALYRYWNMIQYFFPYKHLTDKDWNLTLKEYIPRFIQAKNELEYELAAIQIIGDVNDTHANLRDANDKINEMRGDFYPPFHLRFIEDKFVVTDYYNPEFKEAAGLEIGDIITHINERPVDRIVDSLRDYYPASNDAARMRDIAADLLRSTNPKINIRYTSGGMANQKWLDGNIGYVTLQSIKAEDVLVIKDTFKNAKGLIIDIRNYPSTFVVFSLGSYFVSASTPFVKFTKGNTDNPGEFAFTQPLELSNSSDTYKGKLIVIVNELTQSQAEYTSMAFRAGDNTTIIGSTTAGADGNGSTILLPGGLRTMISGIGVYYPDGTETQRVGIIPDIEVKPTIEGIRNGKDELLEKAVELINL